MNKYLLIIGLFILLPFWGGAQDFVDALRYSSVKLEGTARSGGMGNAFGALGGDFTGVGINPAGLGLFLSSEVVLSPTFGMNKVNSSYLGYSMQETDYKLGMSNFSYVAAIPSKKNNTSGLVGINVGMGYNRLRDFNSFSIAEGHNAGSSFMDYIAENANHNDWSEFYEDLASQADLLQYDTQLKEYWHDIQDAGYGHSQRKSFNRSGTLVEYTLGLGLNFNHRLYLGASLGIIDLYYKEKTTLTEWDKNNNIPFLNDYEFNTSLKTYGTGYNFKLGIIFKPVNEVRLGASLATPTFYSLHDAFETSIGSSITYENNETKTFSVVSPFMEYDYDLVTPFKATLSGAVVLAKKGLVSADLEFLDYSIAKLRNGGDGENFIDQNKDISDIFKPVTNFRLGGEYRVTEPLSLRAGYELYPSAFNQTAFGTDQPNAGLNYAVYTAGLGYRVNGFFFDIAYRHAQSDEYNLLYPAPLTNDYPEPLMAQFTNSFNKILITFGFRF